MEQWFFSSFVRSKAFLTANYNKEQAKTKEQEKVVDALLIVAVIAIAVSIH